MYMCSCVAGRAETQREKDKDLSFGSKKCLVPTEIQALTHTTNTNVINAASLTSSAFEIFKQAQPWSSPTESNLEKGLEQS